MAGILNAIIAIGGTTAHREPFDAARIQREFIAPARGICCFVALDAGAVRGFQALEWSDPDWPGADRLPADWAFISTYVAPGRHRRGIGRDLFDRTRAAARAAGVRFIDACIRLENAGGLAFYDRMGFKEYRRGTQTVSRRLRL